MSETPHEAAATDIDARIRASIDRRMSTPGLRSDMGEALIAVLEVHKPRLYDRKRRIYVCGTCTPTKYGSIHAPSYTPHPCPTVAAIADELGIDPRP